MNLRSYACGVPLLLLMLAGCVERAGPAASEPPAPTGTSNTTPHGQLPPVVVDVDPPLRFSSPVLIDALRSGGEPVIAATPKGTLIVSAHPGTTLAAPGGLTTVGGAGFATTYSTGSPIWRSTDRGATWALVQQSDRVNGAKFGISDPDLTVSSDGTVCHVDMNFAAAAVSCSQDDGATWKTNPFVPPYGQDRPWLASHGRTLYLSAADLREGNPTLYVSTDSGASWVRKDRGRCGSDLVADPDTGRLFSLCDYSDDNGTSWKPIADAKFPAWSSERRLGHFHELGIDAAGNLWRAAHTSRTGLWVAGSTDGGTSFPHLIDMGAEFGQWARAHGKDPVATHFWSWLNAGSSGRLAVTWLAAYGDADFNDLPSGAKPEIFLFSAVITDAHTTAPRVQLVQVGEGPVHVGGVCRGTACWSEEYTSGKAADRRMGDFFETTLDDQGRLNIVVPVTAGHAEDPVAHPVFFRQVDGPSLLLPGDRMPTQG